MLSVYVSLVTSPHRGGLCCGVVCVVKVFFFVLGSNLYHCCHCKISVVSHWLALDFLKSFVELGCCSLYFSSIYCTFYLFAASC